MYKLADGSLSTDYKVGDEFEVVKRYDKMSHTKGSIVKLLEFCGNQPFFKTVNGVQNYGDEGCYEYWDNLKPHRKQFTKADLKDGMVVTYRNGEERHLFEGELLERDEFKFKITGDIHAALWSDNLMNLSEPKKDIMKVSYMGETLWERKEETAEQKEIKRLRSVIEGAQKALSKLEG